MIQVKQIKSKYKALFLIKLILKKNPSKYHRNITDISASTALLP